MCTLLAGDGRNDSPGYSAMYCTYTSMHHETLEILAMTTVDKRHVGGKSPNMEVHGFQKVLDELLAIGVNVKEVVTDQHPSITALMSRY